MTETDSAHTESPMPKQVAEMEDEQRLFRYASRYFARHNGKVFTPFPTVRVTAKALGWSQKRVAETMDGYGGQDMYLSSFHVSPPDPLADHVIEVAPAVSPQEKK